MLFIYRILINLVLILSPIIVIIRLIKQKESLSRFKEKFCFFTKKRENGNVLWFHGASVGELQSIVPLIEILEKKKEIKKILITSNTLSSSKVIQKLKLKKVVHQFYPIDTVYLTKKFLDYWKPSSAFFIDSEIWPNMIENLNIRNIPTILLNGRITKKTFRRWIIFPSFSKKIFSKFNICLASSNESKKYLIKLGSKQVKFIGNLKFAQSESEKIIIDKNLKKFISLKKTWCASSTHKGEEVLCGKVHNKLKKRYQNLLTIIIPRHVERAQLIESELKDLKLKVHIHDTANNNAISKNTDIIIVNSYGKTKSFYSICKNVFLGGSIVNHGGQNPLEATRYGCNILHGPNVSNFREIYDFLKKNKISQKITTEEKIIKSLNKLFSKKSESKKIQKKLSLIGQKILDSTYKEIKLNL